MSRGSDALKHESDVEHSYFGQSPPGMMPELFAPGVVSSDAR
jgi:hypothetical protein